MSQTIRAFIAVELPEDIQTSIRQLQVELKKYRLNFRWVRAENVHLTLKFLGNITPEALQNASQAMTAACATHTPFDILSSGIGVFPNLRKPRVLWAGVGGNVESLRALQATLDSCLSDKGFAKENRPFKGHLTLGRAKGVIDGRSMGDAMIELNEFSSRMFSVQSLTLFKSHLRKEGAVYTRLINTPLRLEAK